MTHNRAQAGKPVLLKRFHPWLLLIIVALSSWFSGNSWAASNQVGIGELQGLIADHLPQRAIHDLKSLDVLDRSVDLGKGVGAVNFQPIPHGKRHQSGIAPSVRTPWGD